ncbi:TetR/AcrR family transcriptional regulator [Paenibacillus sp. J5C_2022]|nr:TetR/AcrR family transcriptional regulator [Paenibacillus sp. J5C2022]
MNKKQAILQTALEAFVEYGFHGTPITKLIASAGVSNGTFFHYFKTKEELIASIYVATKEELYEFIVPDTAEIVSVKKGIRELWYKWIQWGSEHEQKFKFLELFASSPFIHRLHKEEMKRQFAFIEQLLNRGIQEEVIVPMKLTLLSEHIYGSIRGMIMYQQKYGKLSEDEMQHMFHLLWRSIVQF